MCVFPGRSCPTGARWIRFRSRLNHTRPKVLVARYTDALVGALRRFTARLHAQACAYERQCEAQPRQGGLRSLTRTCCSRLHPTRLPPAAPRTHRHMLCTAVRQDTYGTRAPWSAQLGRTAAARAGSSVGAEASQTTGSRDVYVLSLGHVCALSLARLRVAVKMPSRAGSSLCCAKPEPVRPAAGGPYSVSTHSYLLRKTDGLLLFERDLDSAAAKPPQAVTLRTRVRTLAPDHGRVRRYARMKWTDACCRCTGAGTALQGKARGRTVS